MPNPKPARGIYRCRSGTKPIACFSTLSRTRYSSVDPGNKIQQSQFPSETNYSYGPPAAGVCPIEDGTLGVKAKAVREICACRFGTFTFTPGLLH